MRKESKIVMEKGARLARRVGAEVEANFQAWVDRNIAGRRSGRIGFVSYVRAGALDDHVGDDVWYADAKERAWLDYHEPMTTAEFDYLVSHPLVMMQYYAGITDLRGIRCLRRGLTQRVNALQRKAYRGRYYARDNARRRLLAAERRKITRRTTLNPCPTPESFRDAFSRVGDSVAAKIRFGGLVHDLECYVDNCLRIDDRGEIVGRNGGIKAWIFDNVPELLCRYKTIMRYKALAKRVRQVAGVKDPVPTDVLLDGVDGIVASDASQKGTSDAKLATGRQEGARAVDRDREDGFKSGISGLENYYAIKSHDEIVQRARRRVAEVFKGCENTVVAVFACVDAELDRPVPV